MEFFQFHPTGIHKLGILITEGVRGEGGVLRNDLGERFMEKYAPTMKDLASRDVVARAINQEIREGRGINGKKYVYLDATHLGAEVIEKKLPDIADFCRTYLGVDPVKEPMPIQPTAHYAMGGIPTDVDCRVILDDQGSVCPACTRRARRPACPCTAPTASAPTRSSTWWSSVAAPESDMVRFCRENDMPAMPENPTADVAETLERLLGNEGGASGRLREEMQDAMMDGVGIFRDGPGMEKALAKVRELKQRYRNVMVDGQGEAFNTDLLEAWELGNLLDLAEVTAVSAVTRTESRGAHMREDYLERDDTQWLKHTLAYRNEAGEIDLRYKPVTITKFQPKERVY
jgi:succinate dehydrogenase / fumarate reductase, flavoprotein subunit